MWFNVNLICELVSLVFISFWPYFKLQLWHEHTGPVLHKNKQVFFFLLLPIHEKPIVYEQQIFLLEVAACLSAWPCNTQWIHKICLSIFFLSTRQAFVFLLVGWKQFYPCLCHQTDSIVHKRCFCALADIIQTELILLTAQTRQNYCLCRQCRWPP